LIERRKRMGKNYIPSSYALFDLWFKFLMQYVLSKATGTAPAWTHIPQAALDLLTDAYAAWYLVYGKTLGPHTPVDTLAKKEGKKAAGKIIRPFVNQYLRFWPVTDEDRAAMGIPNYDLQPTPVPRPADIPEVEVLISKPRILQFRFRRANMKRWGKPAGVHGMELVWVSADVKPKEIEELIHSAFATKSPLELAFKESDRGKHIYFAVRWETGAMKKGDFSVIYEAIVP
jgi:hypothetical protein